MTQVIYINNTQIDAIKGLDNIIKSGCKIEHMSHTC